jgi:hypothetical protein
LDFFNDHAIIIDLAGRKRELQRRIFSALLKIWSERRAPAAGRARFLKAFHQVVLVTGSLPLSILEKIIGSYIHEAK